MRDISERIQQIPLSPIRKLTPLADEAKSRGIRVYHLNIGQPDIHTPEEGLDAVREIDRKVLEYSPSQGFLSLREKISEYYADFGMDYSPEDIIVTTGASEAVLFSFITCMDPGDELITTEPTYANYLSFAAAAGVRVVPITTRIEDGFALPPAERFEELITEKTRGSSSATRTTHPAACIPGRKWRCSGTSSDGTASSFSRMKSTGNSSMTGWCSSPPAI